jgi:hypothetical protein
MWWKGKISLFEGIITRIEKYKENLWQKSRCFGRNSNRIEATRIIWPRSVEVQLVLTPWHRIFLERFHLIRKFDILGVAGGTGNLNLRTLYVHPLDNQRLCSWSRYLIYTISLGVQIIFTTYGNPWATNGCAADSEVSHTLYHWNYNMIFLERQIFLQLIQTATMPGVTSCTNISVQWLSSITCRILSSRLPHAFVVHRQL